MVLIVSMMRVLPTTLSGPRQLHALVEGTCGAFLLAGRERIRLRAQTIVAYREQAPLVRLTTLEKPNKTRFDLAWTKLSCLTRGCITPEQQVLDLGEDLVMHCRVRTGHYPRTRLPIPSLLLHRTIRIPFTPVRARDRFSIAIHYLVEKQPVVTELV